MKKLTATTLFAMGLFAQLQATDLFTPVQKTDLRLPSVPLITSDPYLSIWSPYDKLNEGTTRHWTNDEKSLIGAVRVDGKVYRFMGKQALESLLPMAGSEEWEGNYTFDAPQGEWTAVNYNAEGWKKGKGAFGTNDMPVVRTSWNTKDIWVRREFTLNCISMEKNWLLPIIHGRIMLFWNYQTRYVLKCAKERMSSLHIAIIQPEERMSILDYIQLIKKQPDLKISLYKSR